MAEALYWYKLWADHGPGHQSRTEFYLCQDKVLSSVEKRDWWEYVFREKDYPIGGIRRVSKLPRKVVLEKRLDALATIKEQRTILNNLKEQPKQRKRA